MKEGTEVHYPHDPDWVGKITRAGEEVSEVCWPNGMRQFVSNKKLEEKNVES